MKIARIVKMNLMQILCCLTSRIRKMHNVSSINEMVLYQKARVNAMKVAKPTRNTSHVKKMIIDS